jgi:toxin FitB
MYLLDTNVVSELRKLRSGKANPGLVAWSRTVPTSSLLLCAATVLELELGVLLMERRDRTQGAMLRTWLDGQVMPAFAGRVLAIDTAVALRCAGLHVPNRRPDRDALIAATALVHGLTLVTRNVTDFAGTGATLCNPWSG